MAPSQLKQLKASLREHGVLGPQKSKKQKKATSKDAQKRLQRNAALEGIRERFNPFEVKAPARREKFEVATNAKNSKPAVGRPGVTRGLGEERRRETLLKEIQSRNKVGGLLDRRFGENDPTMTPEERAAERFARQNERKLKKTSMFNLEDDSEGELALTHGGRSLFDVGDSNAKDDFDEDDIADDDEEDFEAHDDRPRKRLRIDGEGEDEEGDEMIPQRKKTKNEVMKEIIAKSKMYKAERQAAKADDDDLRLELDKGMHEFYEAMKASKLPPPAEKQPPPTTEKNNDPHMDPARAAMLAGKSREAAEKEFEANLRQLRLEARSKPSVRTKTEEEKAAEEAARLEELERKRIRRMKGEVESSEDESDDAEPGPDEDVDVEQEDDDAEAFGLSAPAPPPQPKKELDVEDEDEFLLEDDLIASDSEADMASEQGSEDSSADEDESDDDGDDDFINGLVLPEGTKSTSQSKTTSTKTANGDNLAYTFPCPQTHGEFLEVVMDTKLTDLPTVVQRIRALYHKGLAQGNQEKLDAFAGVLAQHVAYLADSESDVPFAVLEGLLRHLHSMAKASPEMVGTAFRQHLQVIADERPLQLTAGDLIMLTGVSTIFPTSDHFHTVVTPAMLTIGRYLGQSSPQSLQDLGVGAYCSSLALQYQRVAQRYVPEVIVYITNALAILSPVALPDKNQDGHGQPWSFPIRLPAKPLRIPQSSSAKEVHVPEKLDFSDLVMDKNPDHTVRALVLLKGFVRLAAQAAQLWKQKTAFPEMVEPLLRVLRHISSPSSAKFLPKTIVEFVSGTVQTLEGLQKASLDSRRPLLLHNHRPLAIKTSIPAFIENYNPDRHYDPDRQRAEISKLKAEYKKERKGAMRELRKDANFMAREQLREKKEKDEAYDKKFKRLVAEIQGEEGREKKEYEKEKRKRKGRF
ncbi:putative nucleolar complex protein 14 [Exophiala dermatitidis]